MTQWQAASAGRVYRIGDKVMQLRNNYDTGTAGCSTARSGVTALLLEDSDLRVLNGCSTVERLAQDETT
jgi:ATP-dependent exoDNAse (exonuclease V) alpha subunit